MKIKILMLVYFTFSICETKAQFRKAKSTFLSVYSGVSQSNFDFENRTRAHAIPTGFSLMHGGTLKLGLDISTNIAYPYTFIAKDNNDQEIYRDELQLSQANLFVLIEFNKHGFASPYLKGGGGIYTGKMSKIDSSQTESINFSISDGYNYGVGLIIGKGFNIILEFLLFNSEVSSDSNSDVNFQSNWSQLNLGFAFEF